jgi:hypothetical protein
MTSSQGFQSQASYNMAPGVEGDFASTNPRSVVLAGPGGLIAGSSLHVGRFAWTTPNPVDSDGAPALANDFGTGAPAGFVHRDQQGLIVDYLVEASLAVQQGFPVTLFDGGDFWVKNNGATQALPGMKAYANFADGKVTFAATGAPTTDGSCTGTIAAGTSSFTGVIAGNILTASAVTGLLVNGTTVSGSGVASGTKIVSQIDGTAHGAGTYYVSIPEQTVASEAMTGTYGLFTVVSALTGAFNLGDVLAGSGGGGVTTGTTITELGTGAGGAGTYYVDPTQTVTSSTITVLAKNVETKFFCRSSGLAGEIVKISSQAQG